MQILFAVLLLAAVCSAGIAVAEGPVADDMPVFPVIPVKNNIWE